MCSDSVRLDLPGGLVDGELGSGRSDVVQIPGGLEELVADASWPDRKNAVTSASASISPELFGARQVGGSI